MKLHLAWIALLPLALFENSARADWPTFDRDIQQDVISLNDPAADVVRQRMATVLPQANQPTPHEVRELATTDRGYLLFGDLFETGATFALYEPIADDPQDSPTLALAERVDKAWELRGLWKMPVQWTADETRWQGTGKAWTPKETPHRPWVLEDVVGDETPDVIVAGEFLKYRQVSYLLGYDAKSRGLKLLDHAMAKPAKAGNHVRLYECSPNKAIWQKWMFLELKDGQLVERASWYTETPFNNVDPPYNRVTTTNDDGTQATYRVNMGKLESGNLWTYEILKDTQPFAKVAVKWMPETSTENRELIQAAWIFEKLTGLPYDEFPQRYGPETNEKPKLERLDDCATVEVEIADGNQDARRRFPQAK